MEAKKPQDNTKKLGLIQEVGIGPMLSENMLHENQVPTSPVKKDKG
jgi:hypothetical protein